MATTTAGLPPSSKLGGSVEHWNRAQINGRGNIRCARTIEHCNPFWGYDVCDGFCLGPMGDEEIPATGLPQPRSNFARAKAIAIGLHGSTGRRIAAQPCQCAPVFSQSPAIEPQPDRRRKAQSSSLSLFSGSQNSDTMKAIATTPMVYQSPLNAPPVFTTIYCEMKGRKPPK